MKRITSLHIISFLFIGYFSYSQEVEDIDALVEQLGDEDYQTRSKARSKLWLLGEGNEKKLNKYKEINDPQIRYNLNLISNYLSFGVTVDTPKDKLELIDRLLSSSDNGAIEADVNTLMRDKDFEILIKMSLFHRSESVRLYLKPLVDKVITPYLRDLYDAEDFAKAELTLKALSKTDVIAQCYASLLIYKDRGESFIDEMDSNDEEAMVIALYIHIAKKRWGAALILAEKLEKEALVCKLNLYRGNADRILNYTASFKSTFIQKQVFSAAKAINNSDFSAAEKSLDLIANTFRKNTTDSRTILLRSEMLMLNGVTDHLDHQIEKFYLGADDISFSSNIVDYCVSSGRVEAFYKIINCPANKSEQLIWANKIITSIQQDKESELDLTTRSKFSNLMHYVHFMVLNNENELVSELLDPLMEVAISRIGNKELLGSDELFNRLISNALSYGYNWYLVDVMHSLNPEAFAIFNKTIEDIILDQIGVLNLNLFKVNLGQVSKGKGIKLTDSEMLEKILLLQGFSNKSKTFNVLEIQQNILELPHQGKEKEEVLTLLYNAAASRGDMLSLKMLVKEIQNNLNDEYKYFRFTQEILMAESKWQEAQTYRNAYYKDLQKKRDLNDTAEGTRAKNLFQSQNEINHMIKDLIILVKLSKDGEADLLRKKLKLYLAGDVRTTLTALLEFSSYQLNEDFMSYFESVFFEGNLYTNELIEAVSHMNFVNNAYIKQGKYTEAYGVAIFHKYLSIARFDSSSPLLALRISNQADLTKGLSLFKSDPKLAETYLRRCVETSINGGILADFYFPAVKKIGLNKLHKQSFELIQNEMVDLLKKFPNNSNALNAYAWTAAKAGYDLDNAKVYSKRSLELSPYSSAYLDTLAEVYFALGDRESAIKYSALALEATFSGKEAQNFFLYSNSYYNSFMSAIRNRKMLNEQFEHFKNDRLVK